MNEGPATLTGGSPSSGTWGGPGVSGTIFNPSVGTGTHTISYSYTDNNGCSDMATQNVVVDLCTGIANLVSSGENFHLFPNPNNGQFTLDLQSAHTAQLFIYDALGQLVKSQQIQPGTQQIALNVPVGIYLVRVVTTDGKVSQQRVVVE
jgi:hypothetical protein